jgi:hypothetical protein
MFGLLLVGVRLSTLLFAGVSSSSGGKDYSYSFQDEKLKGALELYQEAKELANIGEYQEACDVYMLGIFMGRKTVQSLCENRNDNSGRDDDDPQQALDWLVSSYLACSKARIQMGDWNKARGDAWAACSYSQNTNLEALECMLTVCENTDDDGLGELQTLKSIQQVLLSSSAEATIDDKEIIFKVKDIQQRIAMLEEELERKFKNNDS